MIFRLAFAAALGAAPVFAGPPEVIDVQARRTGSGPAGVGLWRFDVAVRHGDTGWEHYADAWQVLDAEGGVLGTRELLHPHVQEQPFTRSLSGVEIPADAREVQVRARDSVHGWGEPVPFELP